MKAEKSQRLHVHRLVCETFLAIIEYMKSRLMPALRSAAITIALAFPFAHAQADIAFTQPDPALDALVETCLETEGVSRIGDDRVICYNAGIFPEQFLQLADMAPADRIIITGPGGNVATARIMSRILDDRGEPGVIAGQCMSACAMVLLPGLDDVYIHRSAHISVHGITMMDYRTWWGWLKNDEQPSRTNLMMAQWGYDLDYNMHNTGRTQMRAHLKGQGIDEAYIQSISDEMESAAEAHDCRVDPKNYWGMLDAEYITRYLGDRITGMEAFAQDWADPNNNVYKDITIPIADKVYIFDYDYEDAICPSDAE